jgi:hypothetical protein
MIGDRVYQWAWKQTTGTLRFKNILQHVAGYTETHKKVSAATSNAVLAATATVVAGRTITSGITNPDVPRNLTITTGGTTANIAAGSVVIYGTNIEGKPISENFTMADNLNGSVTGNKAFKTVTSVVFPAADGTAATISVGTGAKLGLNHRLVPDKSSIVVIQDTAIDGTAPALQSAPSASSINGDQLELNTITPATTPDGSTFLTIVYWYHDIRVTSVYDNPSYETSTSTSSTSTSTTTTPPTTTSTSSTSVSTSSTSSSTSSTSTSTTTTP